MTQESTLERIEPITAAAQPAFSDVRKKPSQVVFDPKDPFGSLTAGPQQFTILGDTDHTDGSIIFSIANNMKQMAESGVKHIMIEYLPTPDMQNIINQLYQKPPAISDEELRSRSYLFESARAQTPEEAKQTGLAYTELLIQARNNNVMLHFAGDNISESLLIAQQRVLKQQEEFKKANPVLNRQYEEWMDNQSKYQDLEPAQRAEIEGALLKYGNTLLSYLKRSNDLGELREKVRMDYSAEQTRADRFIALSGGEKSVVVFGSNHMEKEKDLNEALDERLRQQALKEGNISSFERSRVMNVYASRDVNNSQQNLPSTKGVDVQYFVKENEAVVTSQGRDVIAIGNNLPGQDSQPAPIFKR